MEDYKRLMLFYEAHNCGERVDYVALAEQNEQDVSEFAHYDNMTLVTDEKERGL